MTDYRNLIVHWEFGPLTDPVKLASKLENRAGIVEHGLFLGLARELIVAKAKGSVRWNIR